MAIGPWGISGCRSTVCNRHKATFKFHLEPAAVDEAAGEPACLQDKLRPENVVDKYRDHDFASLMIPRSRFLGFLGRDLQTQTSAVEPAHGLSPKRGILNFRGREPHGGNSDVRTVFLPGCPQHCPDNAVLSTDTRCRGRTRVACNVMFHLAIYLHHRTPADRPRRPWVKGWWARSDSNRGPRDSLEPRRFRREWTISSPLAARSIRGAGRSCLSLSALKRSGSLCTFRRCTAGLAQGCHRPCGPKGSLNSSRPLHTLRYEGTIY